MTGLLKGIAANEDVECYIDKVFLDKHNVIWFRGEIDEQSIEELTKKILFVATEGTKKKKEELFFPDIHLFLNSEGGEIYEMLRLYDLTHGLKNHVNIHAQGKAFSAGALITACCATGVRRAGKNTTFLIHEISSWTSGKYSAMKQDFEEVKRLQELITKMLLQHTKLSKKEITELCKKDTYFDAEQALKWGFIDEIV